MLKFEIKIVESFYNNIYLIIPVYILITLNQLFYLKYKKNKSNIFLFISNKILMSYFIIYQLILNKKGGSLVDYMLSIFIAYFIVILKEKRKNIFRIERFFTEDIIVGHLALIIISYI